MNKRNPRHFKFPNGNTIEVYTMGELASELGRTPDAIRKWELSGVLPPTCFRDSRGHRLYTQEQIDAIRTCAEKSKISQGRSSLATFKSRVHKSLKELEEKYIILGGYNNENKVTKKSVE